MSAEEAVRAFQRDRLSNDFGVIRGWFSEHAEVRLNDGGRIADQSDRGWQKIPADHAPGSASDTIGVLLDLWSFEAYAILSIISEGTEAVCRTALSVTSRATETRSTIEMSEHFSFDGEHFSQLVLFFDTALTVRVLPSH